MNTDDKRPAISPGLAIELGDAIDRHDLPGAMQVLGLASGTMLPPLADDDLVLLDLDGKPLPEDSPAAKRRRRKKPALLDASGYPTVASLEEQQVRALVQAVWARCHGQAVRQTGFVRAYRKLLERQLVEVAPKTVSGQEVTWYAATSLGTLVVCKALLVGNRRVVRAAAEIR